MHGLSHPALKSVRLIQVLMHTEINMFARLAIWSGLMLIWQVTLPGAATGAQPAPIKPPLPQLTIKLETIEYPAAPLTAKMQGRVLVAFTITKRGRVDEPVIVAAEPAGVFDDAAIKTIKQVRFTVPDGWEASGGSAHRFQVSVLFKLNPCVAPQCVAPKPHEGADDFLIVGAQAPR